MPKQLFLIYSLNHFKLIFISIPPESIKKEILASGFLMFSWGIKGISGMKWVKRANKFSQDITC